MVKKKTGKKKIDKGRMIEVMLAVVAAKGWAAFKHSDVARRCKIKTADTEKEFPEKVDFLKGLAEYIDCKTSAAIGNDDFSVDESPRDRLFAVMMERFDVLQDNRDGIVAILKGLRKEPRDAAKSLPHLGDSMKTMLELAGVESSLLQVIGLTVIYVATLCSWVNDETPDMTKTMATLDKRLQQAESLMGFINRP